MARRPGVQGAAVARQQRRQAASGAPGRLPTQGHKVAAGAQPRTNPRRPRGSSVLGQDLVQLLASLFENRGGSFDPGLVSGHRHLPGGQL